MRKHHGKGPKDVFVKAYRLIIVARAQRRTSAHDKSKP
jgi:hypothetical protein